MMLRIAIALSLCVAWQVPYVGQETPAVTDAVLELQRSYLGDSLKWFEFTVEGAEQPLEPKVVLSWNNISRGGGGTVGMTAIWADDTRPHVIAAIFPWHGNLYHETDVLSREGALVGARKESIVWSPKTTGVEFKPIPGAPPVADSETRRRLQIKELASQFSARLSGRPGGARPEELRMLPQFLYRYGKEGTDLLDGALFAFVTGTDPEAIVMVEAFRETEGEYQWQYAFVRRTSGAVEGSHKNSMVWKVPVAGMSMNFDIPHTSFSDPLPTNIFAVE